MRKLMRYKIKIAEGKKVAFINKILGRDEREENLKKEVKSLELRKESILVSINGEITSIQAEQKRILLEAGQYAYGIWSKEKLQADMTTYFEQIKVLDDKIAQEEMRKKEMSARYDEEIKLISGNIAMAVPSGMSGSGNVAVSSSIATSIAGGAGICPKCNSTIASDDVFCQSCGTKLQ